MPYKNPEQQHAAQRAWYERHKAADREGMLAKHRIIKRGIRTRGVYGLYAKYFGQRRGRPTEADRIALQVILDMPPERRVEFEWKEADEGSASAS